MRLVSAAAAAAAAATEAPDPCDKPVASVESDVAPAPPPTEKLRPSPKRKLPGLPASQPPNLPASASKP